MLLRHLCDAMTALAVIALATFGYPVAAWLVLLSWTAVRIAGFSVDFTTWRQRREAAKWWPAGMLE